MVMESPKRTEPAERTAAVQATEIARLAGAWAHEIRGPISVIRLNMELLAEDFADPKTPQERRLLDKIQVVLRECQRLEDMVNNFLAYIRPRPMRFVPTNLNDQVRRVLRFFAPKAQEARIEIIDYLAPDLPSVLLDPEAFHGALFNLVLNAQEAMPSGGQLVVRTYAIGDKVALDLIDTGVGMDQKTCAQIFDPFFTTKPGGSGLGLPTAKKIIEAHDGEISVQSELGRGTKVTIKLPVPPRLPPEAAATGTSPGHSGSPQPS